MIKHIVINGGGPSGLISYGTLKHLFENNFVDIDNIKSIYGTSIGGIFGVMISLKYDWNTLDDYLMKRPWDKVFKMEPDDLFGLYYNKGLFSFNMVEEFLKPLLEAKDLSINITLEEYYEYNKIDHHFFTVDINNMTKIDISHKTHSTLKLITALEMTTAIPIFFKPVFLDGIYYIDGGLLNNYPVKDCMENEKCENTEILGIRNQYSDKLNMHENMNLLEYLQGVQGRIIRHMQKDHLLDDIIPYEVKCVCDKNMSNYSEWLSYITEQDKRIELIEEGVKYGELFLNYYNQLQVKTEV
jgi:predicted acylesterase/phospholipase RssA